VTASHLPGQPIRPRFYRAWRKPPKPRSDAERKREKDQWDEMEWTQHQFDPDLDPDEAVDFGDAEFIHQVFQNGD